MARRTKAGANQAEDGPPQTASNGTNTSPAPAEPRGNAFVEAVKYALDHIGDTQHLGEKSPLAAPYFLGAFLDGKPGADTAAGRGQVLIMLLTEAIQALAPDLREVMRLYYLDPDLQRSGTNRATVIEGRLYRAKPTLMRNLREGRQLVAQHLSSNVLPPLRAEWPGHRTVVGRRSIINTLMAALRQTQPVALTAVSGTGKTSVGYALAEEWGRGQVLWFTLRPELNDRLLSLVLTLGYFLRTLGAGNTWRQLVADEGKLGDDALISSLIRQDLDELKRMLKSLPLVVIDDLEILRPELQEHVRLKHFIEALCGHTPLLLIGQRVIIDPLDPHNHHDLAGFGMDELDDLLTQEGVFYLSAQDKAQLLRATHGNPALIRMFAVLQRTGDSVGSVLSRMGVAMTADAMLSRVWGKLERNEQRLLSGLAVFRDFAPRDAWPQPEARIAIGSLAARGLVDEDDRGGIAVASFAREFVLRQTPADARQQAHLAAALVREQRGEYTLAVAHYIAANQPTIAVRLWAPHRVAERARGNGSLALAQFRNVLTGQLETDDDRRVLALILAEQTYARGESDALFRAIEGASWPDDHPLTPIARGLLGDAHRMEDHIEQAAASYAAGLKALERPAETIRVTLHRLLGHMHGERSGDLKAARTEAMYAQFEAQVFMGYVEARSGNYDIAKQHYVAALEATDALPNNARQQRDSYSALGQLAMHQGDLDAAFQHLERAIALAKQTGQITSLATDQITLSGVHILSRQYEQALEVALDGLQLCESGVVKSAYHLAGLASNAGEACFYLGRYDDAVRFASQAVATEEVAFMRYALTVIGMALHAQAKHSQAELVLRQALAQAQDSGDLYAEAAALRELGLLLNTLQRAADAQEAYQRSLDLFHRLGNAMEAEAMQARLAELQL